MMAVSCACSVASFERVPMTPKSCLAGVITCLIAISGCTTASAPPQRQEPQPPTLASTCGADGLQSLVGQPASVLQSMRFGTTTRIIRPGMAVTMDFSPSRLNIEIDTAEVITRVSCG